MSGRRHLDAADALLAAPVARQQAERAAIVKRNDTSKPASRVPALLRVIAAMFGIKTA